MPGRGDGRAVSRFRQRPRDFVPGGARPARNGRAENDEPVAGLAVDRGRQDARRPLSIGQKVRPVLLPESSRRIVSSSPRWSFFDEARIAGSRRFCRGVWSGWSVWATGRELLIVDASSGVVWHHVPIAGEFSALPTTGILLPAGSSTGPLESRLMVLTHDGPRWIVFDMNQMPPEQTPLRWQPGIPGSSSLCSLQISSRFVPPFLDLLGLDATGAVHAAQFHAEDGSLELVAERVASIPGGYLAAAHTGTNRVVAIASRQIDWLDASAERFSVAQTVNVGLHSAVACFNSPCTREVLVVCSDGFIARIVAPRRSSTIRG